MNVASGRIFTIMDLLQQYLLFIQIFLRRGLTWTGYISMVMNRCSMLG